MSQNGVGGVKTDAAADKHEPPITIAAVKIVTPASLPEGPGAVQRLPVLDVHTDYELWKFRVQAILNRVPPHDHYMQLMLSLTDDALRRAISGGFSSTNSLAANWKVLDDCFCSSITSSTYVDSFITRQQQPEESAADYMHQLRHVAMRAFTALPPSTLDDLSNTQSSFLIFHSFHLIILSILFLIFNCRVFSIDSRHICMSTQ